MSVHLKKIGWEEYLHAVFNYFDKNRSGYIEMEELRDALQDESVAPTDEVIRDIFHDVDTDKVQNDSRFTRVEVPIVKILSYKYPQTFGKENSRKKPSLLHAIICYA